MHKFGPFYEKRNEINEKKDASLPIPSCSFIFDYY